MSIPRIIHQIWYQSWNNLPEKYAANVKSVQDKNPGWQYRQWDESTIGAVINSLGQEYVDKFNKFKFLHQKIDFARYAILYLYGGVSVDVDAVALKSFDNIPDLSTSNLIVSKNSTNQFINNATIFASVKNDFLKSLLDGITSDCKAYQSQSMCITSTTGPVAFNDFLKKYTGDITVLPNYYLEPCSGHNNYCELNPLSILDHQHEGTWLSGFELGCMRFSYFWQRYWILIIAAIIAIIILVNLNKTT